MASEMLRSRVRNVALSRLVPVRGFQSSIATRCRTESGRNYYDVLGVLPTASQAEIKEAFRKLAKEHHPDVAGPGADAEAFKEIAAAYAELSKRETREAYNLKQEEQSPQAAADRLKKRNERNPLSKDEADSSAAGPYDASDVERAYAKAVKAAGSRVRTDIDARGELRRLRRKSVPLPSQSDSLRGMALLLLGVLGGGYVLAKMLFPMIFSPKTARAHQGKRVVVDR